MSKSKELRLRVFHIALALFMFYVYLTGFTGILGLGVVSRADAWDGLPQAISIGTGAAGTPYQIGTPGQLKQMADWVNAGNNADKSYKLTADIDLEDSAWTPIGKDELPFSGTFDGDNHLIRNVKVNGGNIVGLFGYVQGGTIRNLDLANLDITGTDEVGGLAGNGTGVIENVYVGSGSVIRGVNYVGGLVGQLDEPRILGTTVEIRNSFAWADVGGANHVGGLVGYNGGTIKNSFAAGIVTQRGSGGYDNGYIGGFMGGGSGNVENSYAVGAVNGSVRVGGLVGASGGISGGGGSTSGHILGSYATGRVIGAGSTGGLAGGGGITITNSTYDSQTIGLQNDGSGTISLSTEVLTSSSVSSSPPFNNAANFKVIDGYYPQITAFTVSTAGYQGEGVKKVSALSVVPVFLSEGDKGSSVTKSFTIPDKTAGSLDTIKWTSRPVGFFRIGSAADGRKTVYADTTGEGWLDAEIEPGLVKSFNLKVTAAFPVTFVPVTNITDVPTAGTVGAPLVLTGTVAPADATNGTIVWSVKSAGTTGATITGSTLNATATGTATITATIADGATASTPYTQDFDIDITVAAGFVPVTNITGVPATGTVGAPLVLTGTVTPADATNRTIVWSVKSAGTTGATITGNTLNAAATGTVTITATVANGATAATAYTQDFGITIRAAGEGTGSGGGGCDAGSLPLVGLLTIGLLCFEQKRRAGKKRR
jgi:hypothetical protein